MNPIGFLRQRIKAHHFSRAALVLGGIATAFVLFVAGAGIRLLIGPVSLGPFAGSLSAAIDRAVPGITVKYDQAAVEWERDEGRITLAILGTRVLDHNGRIIAQAPKAEIGIAAGPFLNGKIEVKRISLVGVQLTLLRARDGRLQLGTGADRQDEDIIQRLSDMLNKSEGPSTLESFAIKRARLAFLDEASRLFVVAPRADFSLNRQRGSDHLNALIDANIEISGFPSHLKGAISLPSGNGPVTGRIALSGFSLHALAANSAAFAAMKNTALKLDLAANFVKDASGLRSADFTMSGSGPVTVPHLKDGRVQVSVLKAKGHFIGPDRRFELDEAVLVSDKIKAALKGRLSFALNEAGDLSGLQGELKIGRLGVAWPGVFAKPVQFEAVDLKAGWQRIDKTLTIEKVAIGGAPFVLQAEGKVQFDDKLSPAISVKGSIAALSARDLVHYWPLGAASGGRDWVETNMPSGRIGPLTFEIHLAPGMLDLPALPAQAILVKAAVSDAQAIYIKGLTPLSGLNGILTITGNSFTADIISGHIGAIRARPSHFTIPDFSAPEEIGIVDAHLAGPMADVLALVDMGNLRYPTRFGINAASAKGDAVLDLDFRIPLLKTVSVDRITMAIKANVNGFGLALGPKLVVTDGNVLFQIDNAKLHATGAAGIGGSPSKLAFDWTEEFANKAVTTRVSLKGPVDDVARAALGINTRDFLKGPIGVTGSLQGRRGSLTVGNLALDLTQTAMTIDLLAVNKPAGFPMNARMAITFGPNSSIDTQTIRVFGPGSAITATAKFEPGGRLVNLQAPQIRLGNQNDFSLAMTRGVFGLDVQVRGHSLDGSRLGGESGSSDEARFDEPFHINAKLDKLVLRDGVAMSNFAFDISGVAERLATLNLSAAQSKSAGLSMTMGPSEGGRRLSVTTADMGLLLKGLFGFSSMQGGKLEASVQFAGKADQPASGDGPDFQGKAVLKDFRVLNQPFLARLFSAGSLMGLANLMQGQGIAFDMLDVPFASKNGVISVHDVRATGPATGVTADGYVDRPKNAIAIKGSLVPLFGLNSVLGNIPLLGTVITSKQGEGIIGMTYSVSGNADEPSVSVNPLSALAPGIFRRIFEGRIPNASQAPTNNPTSSAAPSNALVPKTKN